MIKNLISVIVPVYNVEQFLPDFFDSIDAQKYKNFEIIFVDDCSNDNSKKLINQFCLSHPNTRLVNHTINLGASSARNTGLNYINGEYFTFVDPDDMLHPNLFQTYFDVFKNKKVDFIACDYLKVSHRAKFKELKFYEKNKKTKFKVLNQAGMIHKFINMSKGPYELNVWTKCFRTRTYFTLQTFPKIACTKIQSVGDDAYICSNFMSNCNNCVVITNKKLYLYRIHDNSAMRSDFNHSKMGLLLCLSPLLNNPKFKSKKYQKHFKALLSIYAYRLLFWSITQKYQNKDDIDAIFLVFKRNKKFCWTWKCTSFFYCLTPMIYPLAWIVYKRYIQKLSKTKLGSPHKL